MWQPAPANSPSELATSSISAPCAAAAAAAAAAEAAEEAAAPAPEAAMAAPAAAAPAPEAAAAAAAAAATAAAVQLLHLSPLLEADGTTADGTLAAREATSWERWSEAYEMSSMSCTAWLCPAPCLPR